MSYTLVDLGDDEVSSVGVFTSAAGAEAANATAAAWTKERLGSLVDSPLDSRAGTVLVDFRPLSVPSHPSPSWFGAEHLPPDPIGR